MQLEQVQVESDEMMNFFFFFNIHFLAWLSNIFVKYFKFIYLCLQSSDWLNKLIVWSVYFKLLNFNILLCFE